MAVQVMLSAVAAGGAIGVSDQFLCLLLLSIAAKTNLVTLSPEVDFLGSTVFLVIVAIFWVLTILPAYGTFIAPGVLNVINTTLGVVSGVMVPASGALLALATAGIVTEAHPEAGEALFGAGRHLASLAPATGQAGVSLWLVGGGGALLASLMTFVKFLIKPMLATATGTAGTVSAPVYKTVENVLALVLMVLVYVLASVDPWLLVAFMALVVLALLALLGFAFYKLWQMGRGVGRVLRLLQSNPKAGLAVVLEPFVWGAGWTIMEGWQSGVYRFILWAICLALIVFVVPLVLGPLAVAFPPLLAAIPSVQLALGAGCVYLVGVRSAGALLKKVDRAEAAPGLALAPSPSPSP